MRSSIAILTKFKPVMSMLVCSCATFVILPQLLAQPVRDADFEKRLRLAGNMKQLEVVFTLDRTEYLPGEDPLATIRIKNPTSRALEIYVPFHDQDCKIKLHKKSDENLRNYGTEWWPIGADPDVVIIGDGVPSYPTTTIEAGAEWKVEQYLDGREGLDAAVRYRNFILLSEGDYRAVYSFGGGPAPFRVVQPRRMAYRNFDRRPIESLRAVGHPTPPLIVAVLGDDTGETLVIPVGPRAIEKVETDPDGRVSMYSLGRIAPFVRIASSKAGFAAYEAHQAGDQIVVSWESRDGDHGVKRFEQVDELKNGRPQRYLNPVKD